jgi:hypothetical protein
MSLWRSFVLFTSASLAIACGSSGSSVMACLTGETCVSVDGTNVCMQSCYTDDAGDRCANGCITTTSCDGTEFIACCPVAGSACQ